jgi:hypothetical protein
MSEKAPEQVYPVKTLHDFLFELNREWRRFKRGALMSLFVLCLLLSAFVPLLFRAIRLGLDILDIIFLGSLIIFLIYDLRLMLRQYRFFKKWGHRMAQLSSLEEKLLDATFEENKSKQPPP